MSFVIYRIVNYHSTSLPEITTINTKLSHIPTVGDLEQLYPETFGGVSHDHDNGVMINIL